MSPAAARAAIAEVEALCTDTGYPRIRFDAGTLGAADLLRRVESRRIPPVRPSDTLATGLELTGRVVS